VRCDTPAWPPCRAIWARALDRAREKEELGGSFYHLAQRRGLISNRKAPEEDERKGIVK
jgi:hypothetical protein